MLLEPRILLLEPPTDEVGLLMEYVELLLSFKVAAFLKVSTPVIDTFVLMFLLCDSIFVKINSYSIVP